MTSQTSAEQRADGSGYKNSRDRVDKSATAVGLQAKRGLRATRDIALERIQQASSGYCVSVAKAVRSGSDQMRQDGYNGSARALQSVAAVLDDVSDELACEHLFSMGAKLKAIAKRRPLVTAGLVAGAGFLVALSLTGRARQGRASNLQTKATAKKNGQAAQYG